MVFLHFWHETSQVRHMVKASHTSPFPSNVRRTLSEQVSTTTAKAFSWLYPDIGTVICCRLRGRHPKLERFPASLNLVGGFPRIA